MVLITPLIFMGVALVSCRCCSREDMVQPSASEVYQVTQSPKQTCQLRLGPEKHGQDQHACNALHARCSDFDGIYCRNARGCGRDACGGVLVLPQAAV